VLKYCYKRVSECVAVEEKGRRRRRRRSACLAIVTFELLGLAVVVVVVVRVEVVRLELDVEDVEVVGMFVESDRRDGGEMEEEDLAESE